MSSVLRSLGCLPLLFASVPLLASDTQVERPNILLVLVDTLRKDFLHLYGYEQKTSTSVDALGQAGWVFENHIAHASQTVPSTLSLMLSRYPAEHGFQHGGPGHFARNRPTYPEGFRFLAETLQEAGSEEVFAENGPWRAVYKRKRKLVFNRETTQVEQYLTSDELDSNPLRAGNNKLRKQLAWYLALEEQTPTHEGDDENAAPWSAEELERLRALGYVN